MFITKEHYNVLLGYRDVALKTIQAAEDVNATNKQVCDFNERLIEELRNERIEVAREIFERLYANIKFEGHTVSVWKNDLLCIAKEYGIDLESNAELKKKYKEGRT